MINDEPLSVIAGLFQTEGTAGYPGSAVTLAAHMLQSAALAERADAHDPLIAAALLHDVGHFAAVSGPDRPGGSENRHSERGARWLSQWFGAEVTEPVRLHVDAQRYLCTAIPGYLSRLPAAAACILDLQGGLMGKTELAEFESSPFAADACRIRRWDEAAKKPGALTRSFDHFRPLLRSLVRPRSRTATQPMS
ncbi:MAG: HD domain-containing protein [Streptosporangiaceae bacterium]|jgi:gamma-butyrobetaine dioxygenase|nr:metal-dependent phosphohydrolase [Actinomycetota bacterium]